MCEDEEAMDQARLARLPLGGDPFELQDADFEDVQSCAKTDQMAIDASAEAEEAALAAAAVPWWRRGHEHGVLDQAFGAVAQELRRHWPPPPSPFRGWFRRGSASWVGRKGPRH